MIATTSTKRSATWLVFADGDGNSDSGDNYPPIPDEDLPF